MARVSTVLRNAALGLSAKLSPDSWGPPLERTIGALSAKWSSQRASYRLQAEQANYLAAAYKSASPGIQRGTSGQGVIMSENGQLTDSDWASIVTRSESTYRNNMTMSGFISRACDSIVGTGLHIMPETGEKSLNQELDLAFRAHCAKGGGWEVTNRYSLGMAQRIGFTSISRSGDLLLYRSGEGWQFFEAGQVGTPWGYNTSQMEIQKGVELDDRGRAARYWVSRFSKLGYIDPTSAIGLRADKCLLIGNPKFFSGTRCLPIYHNALDRFEDMERYVEAELLGAMAASCIMAEINSPHANAVDAFNVTRPQDRGQAQQSAVNNFRMAPAQVIKTLPLEKITMHSPNRPSNMFPDFMRINLRLLGFEIGLPLEMAIMDFTETNYAAAKMAMVQAALTHMYWRELVLYEQMLKPIYLDWLDTQKAVRIPTTIKFPTRHYVIEPNTPWLEELKESQARNAQLEGGWNTLTHIMRQDMNRTIDSLFEERIAEILLAKKMAKAAGIEDQWEKVWKGMRDEKAKSNPDVLQAA